LNFSVIFNSSQDSLILAQSKVISGIARKLSNQSGQCRIRVLVGVQVFGYGFAV
jgi:hypothetical protein